jgi:DNA ligase-1
MLAHPFDKYKHLIGGYYCSEKLDGERCFWDGGISRGSYATSIPWAFKPKSTEMATGLWTRNFKVIHAPGSWVENLPKGVMLDGELYLGTGRFQELMSIVRQELNPNIFLWNKVKFCVFDSPTPQDVFSPGRMRIRGTDFLINANSLEFARRYYSQWPRSFEFQNTIGILKDFKNQIIVPCEQILLNSNNVIALNEAKEKLSMVIENHGEGLMLRAPRSLWFPKRSNFLLKFKEFYDSEATVVGYADGKGRHEGRMGALRVMWINPKDGAHSDFEIGGGFTDSEREWEYIHNSFKIGDTITFRYLNLTDSGVPGKASFHRKKVL